MLFLFASSGQSDMSGIEEPFRTQSFVHKIKLNFLYNMWPWSLFSWSRVTPLLQILRIGQFRIERLWFFGGAGVCCLSYVFPLYSSCIPFGIGFWCLFNTFAYLSKNIIGYFYSFFLVFICFLYSLSTKIYDSNKSRTSNDNALQGSNGQSSGLHLTQQDYNALPLCFAFEGTLLFIHSNHPKLENKHHYFFRQATHLDQVFCIGNKRICTSRKKHYYNF